MSDLVFDSSLTIEQIDENFKDFNYFEALKTGLEEALAHARGEPIPGTVIHEAMLPDN